MDSLGLPPDTRAGLIALASLPDKVFGQLKLALATTPYEIKRRDFVATVASAVVSDTEGQARIESIVSALMYLAGYPKSRKRPERFADEVIAELQTAGSTNASIEPQPAELAELKERLLSVLQIDRIQVRSKASELLFEGAQVYQSSRIVTDIRPVFSGEASPKLVGGLVVHNLKIQFLDVTGTNETYVLLDDDDLRQLRKTIRRAERKADALRSHLKSSSIIDLNPGEPTDA